MLPPLEAINASKHYVKINFFSTENTSSPFNSNNLSLFWELHIRQPISCSVFNMQVYVSDTTVYS